MYITTTTLCTTFDSAKNSARKDSQVELDGFKLALPIMGRESPDREICFSGGSYYHVPSF